MIFQIFLIIFAVIALWKTYQQYQKDHVSLHWFWIWVLLWAAVIFVSLYPATTDMVAEFVGVERGADLIVYIAVVVLLFGFACKGGKTRAGINRTSEENGDRACRKT